MKLFQFFLLIFFLSFTTENTLFSHAQEYHINEYQRNQENPKGLKTTHDNDFSNAKLILNGTAQIGTYSNIIDLPQDFNFKFNNEEVSQFKVSNSGILTFDINSEIIVDNNNSELPSDKIPNTSICIWGLALTGANSNIYSEVYGEAPNRQYWITFSDNRTNSLYTSWAIVLEETSNRFYIVDQAYSYFQNDFLNGLTIGVQIDSEDAISVNGSPNLSGYSKRSLGPSNNQFYTFIPFSRPEFNAEINEYITPQFPNLETAPYEIKFKFKNTGGEIAKTLEINYQIDDDEVVTELTTDIFIPTNDYEVITFDTKWQPNTNDNYQIKIWISKVNSNDVFNQDEATHISNMMISNSIPDKIDLFLSAEPNINKISSNSDGLDKPTDLDFHPDFGLNQLWVINKKTSNSGGSTTTYFNAGTDDQTVQTLKDGNSWHFMSLPTGIAFSENTNFGTAAGVYDANHSGGANQPFTGPSLWSSNFDIYAKNPGKGGNGSHLDMLHESPYCQGIAYETGNAFWVFDGNSNDIVRYDFVKGHGNGNDYHEDGIVRRYSDIEVMKDPNENAVSHLVLDNERKWLYVVDNGNKRILRMNINSGEVSSNPPKYNPMEQLTEYLAITAYDIEVLIDENLTSPAGIDLVDDKLLVSDYETGEIIIYQIDENDSENIIKEIGKIETNAKGINGIKIGPNGDIWYVNTLNNEVFKISPSKAASVSDNLITTKYNVYPNPSKNNFNISFTSENNPVLEATIYDLNSKLIRNLGNQTSINNNFNIEWDGLSNNGNKVISGTYYMIISNKEFSQTIKLVLN